MKSDKRRWLRCARDSAVEVEEKAAAGAEADSRKCPKRTEQTSERKWKSWATEPTKCQKKKCSRQDARLWKNTELPPEAAAGPVAEKAADAGQVADNKNVIGFTLR